jgi:hypothetical protein
MTGAEAVVLAFAAVGGVITTVKPPASCGGADETSGAVAGVAGGSTQAATPNKQHTNRSARMMATSFPMNWIT